MKLVSTILFLITFNASAFQYCHWLHKFSKEFDIEPEIVEAVIAVESSFNHKATSTAGAIGLMQVLYTTAQDMGFKGTLDELYYPAYNMRYGTKYLKYLRKKFENVNVMLDAYWRGEDNVRRWPYEGDWENHRHVSKIMKYFKEGEYKCQTKELKGL